MTNHTTDQNKDDTTSDAKKNELNTKESAEEVTAKEPPEKVSLNKQKIASIKQGLGEMIEAMMHESSVFSRAATYWGKLSIWLKILLGIVVAVPAMVLGIVAHWVILIVASAIVTAVFGFIVFLLTNHYQHLVNRTENLTKGVNGLVDVLDTVITELDLLAKELRISIDLMTQENTKLKEQVTLFAANLEKLTEQMSKLQQTERELSLTNASLKNATSVLETTLAEQKSIFDKIKAELDQVKAEYSVNQLLLSTKTSELDKIKTDMELQVKKSSGIIEALNATIVTLSNEVSMSEAERVQFKEKLSTFLHDKEASFDKIADRICEAERQLVVVKEQLQQANAKYEGLLARQEGVVERLEAKERRTSAPTPSLGSNTHAFLNTESRGKQRLTHGGPYVEIVVPNPVP